ncbi:hypothetical protein BH10PSE18_BH10PSE18_23010 [soil metagenome]
MTQAPYSSLTPELCALLSELASPLGTGRLDAGQLTRARAALSDAAKEARDVSRTLPRAAAQDALLFADALVGAAGTLELIHAVS